MTDMELDRINETLHLRAEAASLRAELRAAVDALRPFEQIEEAARDFNRNVIGSTRDWRVAYNDLRTAAMIVVAYDAKHPEGK